MGLYRYCGYVIFGSAASIRYNQLHYGCLGRNHKHAACCHRAGTIRIKGSRVSLDSIVHHFELGATAEQIVRSFPSLSLGDVYSSIAYYLTHRQEIEEYLKEQETAADALQEQLESNPDYQAEIAELRFRILGRWTAAQENGAATQPYGTI
jgi:uncharacterized protein (DUF433 family)